MCSEKEIENEFKSIIKSLYIQHPEKKDENREEIEKIIYTINQFDEHYINQKDLLLAKILCYKISSNTEYTVENILLALLNIKISKLGENYVKL